MSIIFLFDKLWEHVVSVCSVENRFVLQIHFTMDKHKRLPAPSVASSSSAKLKRSSSVVVLLLLVLASSPSSNEAFSASSSSHPPAARPRRPPGGRLLPNGVPFSSHSAPPRRPLASSLVEHGADDPPAPPSPCAAGGEYSVPPTSPSSSRRPSADAIINVSVLLSVSLVVLEQVLSVDVGMTRGWSAAEVAERVSLDNWSAYSHVLHSAPIRTKALTSGAVYAIGDVISQRSVGAGMGELDRGRVLRSTIAGLVGHGPMSHLWYHASDFFFDDVVRLRHAWWDFAPKVALDQAVFGPIWNNSYILLLGVMQLHGPGRIWDDMRRTTLPLVLSGLRLWPFVHVVTYGLIPVEYRLLWVDAVEIVWVTILASTASSPPPPSRPPTPPSSSGGPTSGGEEEEVEEVKI